MATFTLADLNIDSIEEPIPFAGWVHIGREEMLEATVVAMALEIDRLNLLVESLTIDLAFYKKEI